MNTNKLCKMCGIPLAGHDFLNHSEINTCMLSRLDVVIYDNTGFSISFYDFRKFDSEEERAAFISALDLNETARYGSDTDPYLEAFPMPISVETIDFDDDLEERYLKWVDEF